MSFESPDAYLKQLIAAALSGNEEGTIITNDARIMNGGDAARGMFNR
jgi:hypothetical protein